MYVSGCSLSDPGTRVVRDPPYPVVYFSNPINSRLVYTTYVLPVESRMKYHVPAYLYARAWTLANLWFT